MKMQSNQKMKIKFLSQHRHWKSPANPFFVEYPVEHDLTAPARDGPDESHSAYIRTRAQEYAGENNKFYVPPRTASPNLFHRRPGKEIRRISKILSIWISYSTSCMLLVVKYLNIQGVKKPLNPILGEHFTCKWKFNDGSEALYLAEQVSHHPPMSAYFYMCPEHHIRIDGLLKPRSKFLGNRYIAQW